MGILGLKSILSLLWLRKVYNQKEKESNDEIFVKNPNIFFSLVKCPMKNNNDKIFQRNS